MTKEPQNIDGTQIMLMPMQQPCRDPTHGRIRDAKRQLHLIYGTPLVAKILRKKLTLQLLCW